MKSILLTTILIASISAPLGHTEEFAGEPGSEQWRALYNPPYAKPTEIPRDQPLRKQLFDLARPRIEKAAGVKDIRFQGELKAFKNWAFFLGTALDAKDRAIKFEPMGNTEVAALWLRTADGWKLVDSATGFSDVGYWVWTDQYGAPRKLLGLE